MHTHTLLDAARAVTTDLVRSIAAAQLAEITAEIGENAYAASQFELARQVFEQVALADDFADFLTLPAYAAVADHND